MGNELQDNNLREAIRSLEYLVQIEADPAKKNVYQERLKEYGKQLSEMSRSAKAPE